MLDNMLCCFHIENARETILCIGIVVQHNSGKSD